MIMYHGTSHEYYDSIMKNELLPRSKTDNSNYDGDMASHLNLVYLTTYNPFAYACDEWDLSAKHPTDGLSGILQIKKKDVKTIIIN